MTKNPSIAFRIKAKAHANINNYSDVIMGAMASHINSSLLFTQTFIQAQIKENIKAPLHWPLCGKSPVNSPHKWPVTRKIFPFDAVIMRTEALRRINARVDWAIISWKQQWLIAYWQISNKPKWKFGNKNYIWSSVHIWKCALQNVSHFASLGVFTTLAHRWSMWYEKFATMCNK